MILTHNNKKPIINESAYIAPNATIYGDVTVGKNSCILFGASIIAEGGKINIGDNCIILENAVVRSTEKHHLILKNNILIGPNAHVVGCTIEDNVFIATGASIFHGSVIGKQSEIRINGVVHIKTVLPQNTIIPINWIAIGDPLQILPPDEHEKIWQYQEPLNFPKYVYGIERARKGKSNMKEITKKYHSIFMKHAGDIKI